MRLATARCLRFGFSCRTLFQCNQSWLAQEIAKFSPAAYPDVMNFLRLMLPSGNALFVFDAAARNGSFTAAAAELNVTQPAVSRMLGQFEEHLGVRLFDRA